MVNSEHNISTYIANNTQLGHHDIMKIHILTVGEPKLDYAKSGWQEYLSRLNHYHQVRTTHLADKWAYDADKMLTAAGNAYKIVLIIDGPQLTSHELAKLLESRSNDGRETCFIIGGPEGIPQEVIDKSDGKLSFSKLTFPHDLAMVVLLEALYRASTINANQPYHK